MNLVQLIRCVQGDHRRDGRSVRSEGIIDYSVCKGCGRRMIRDKGYWRLEKREDRRAREGVN